MILKESMLRKIIRACLKEQVVGYTPPSKSGDDSDSGYISYGDLSSPAPTHTSETEDPEDQEQLSAQEQQLTKQRQRAIDSKDSVGANYDARRQQRLRRATG
jgi:hypothetical protein